jgi:adenylate cyclase
VASTRRLAAIMFTDMVGYTASAQANEKATLMLRKEQEDLVRPVLAEHHGREVKSTGDGILVEFESALKATECAVGIQRRLHERNGKHGVVAIQLRIGIHLGDVEQQGTDIFGDAVNIASRIEPVAVPGGICVSGAVYEQVRNKIPDKLEKLPPTSLKGLQIPMDIYRVVLPWTLRDPPSPSPGPIRLAVLPLANISPDPKDEYFADGLTDELIGTLSKLSELRVIARTSVGQYKATSKTIAQIGNELAVTSVLEGSVRKAGNRIRITLQLIDAVTQEHIWADHYDRDLDDVFAIQTEVAEKTASALQLKVLRQERESIGKAPTTDLAAYHLYLKGVYLVSQGGLKGLEESIHFFEEAIRNDPNFSEAYARLANVFIGLSSDFLPVGDAIPRARELIAKALEIDPNLSEAHTARGNLALQYDLDWGVAEAEFKRAIFLSPSNANAHHWYSHLLVAVSRYEDALRESKTTKELDPLVQPPQDELRFAECFTEDFDSPIASAEAARDSHPLDPRYHVVLGLIYADAGRIADARGEAEFSSGPVDKWSEWNRALLWVRLGKPEEARTLVTKWDDASRTEYVSPLWMASLYSELGEKEQALGWLERNNGEGARSLVLDFQLRTFDSIRNDPRFRSLLERLNLPTEVKRARGAGTRH